LVLRCAVTWGVAPGWDGVGLRPSTDPPTLRKGAKDGAPRFVVRFWENKGWATRPTILVGMDFRNVGARTRGVWWDDL
jgi:hypothetical protein